MKFSSAAAFSAAVESYIKSQHRTANKPSQFEEAVASFSQTMQNLKGRISVLLRKPVLRSLFSVGSSFILLKFQADFGSGFECLSFSHN